MPIPVILFLLSFLWFDVNGTYTTKYDNIEIDEVIKNERLVKRYVECLLDKGACTPDGFELKQNMPDAIATNCTSCSEKQKIGSEKFIAFLIDEKPDFWVPLQEKYDPSGDYTKKYLESKIANKAEEDSNDGGASDNQSANTPNSDQNEHVYY